MGGRLAVAFASKYPDKIQSLILESATLGINDNNAKKERYQEDLKLSDLIESNFSTFIHKWENNPLFLNQEKRNKKGFLRQRKDRMTHNPAQLSKALKVFSQGAMESYEKEFSTFEFPIVIINGEEDSKYLKIGKNMKIISEISAHYTVVNSSHNIHLEQVDKFIDYLTSISDPSDICKHCDDVIAYCKCYEYVITDN